MGLYQCGKLDDANELALLFTQKYSQHALGWKVLGALLGQTGQYIAALEANQRQWNYHLWMLKPITIWALHFENGQT